MLRRITAQQVLLQLHDISADYSDGEYSNSELNDALTNDAQAELDSRGEESDVDSPIEDEDRDLQNQVQVNQDLTGKRRNSLANFGYFPCATRVLVTNKNILSFKPGPTAFATSRITESSPLSSFRVLFDEAILRNIRKCTVTKAHCVSGRMN